MPHRTHYTTYDSGNSRLVRTGDLLRLQHPQLVISKRKLRHADAIQIVREKRESEAQNLGFSSRPFVLCGLPVKRPPAGCLLHERRNGRFVLQVTGHPSYGLPWGQDRLVPIFLATMAVRQQSARITFNSAAEMLDTFGIQQGGSQYRRLVASFQRIFGATIFFGTDTQRDRAAVVHCARFNFMTEARIWYSRDLEQTLLPGDCQNVIVLSEEFHREIASHPIPTDLEAQRLFRRARPRWTCSAGSLIAASRRAVESEFRCSVSSGLSANSEVATMRGLASFARSWRDGSSSSGRCGPSVRPTSTRMESRWLWIDR